MIATTDASRPIADATPIRCVTAKPMISKADDAKTQVTQESGPDFRGRPGKGRAFAVATKPPSSRPEPSAAPALSAVEGRRSGGTFLVADQQERSLDCATNGAVSSAQSGGSARDDGKNGHRRMPCREGEATARRSGRRLTATARPRLRPHQPHRTVSCGRAKPLIPNDATASGRTDRTDRKKRPSLYFVVRRAPLTASHGVGRHLPDAPGSLIHASISLFGCPEFPAPVRAIP